MHLAVLGINHKTAPVELREKVSLNGEKCASLSSKLLAETPIVEVVPLSTCNRTEIYLVASRPEIGRREVLEVLSEMAGVQVRELDGCSYFHEGENAVAHLYRVAGSLDSLVVGEAQIMSQIKEAYHAAHENETTSVLLNRLFRDALGVGKRVRTETRIGENPVSVSSVAVEMVRLVFEELEGRTAMLLGTGEMSQLTATHLISNGVSKFIVTNRTFSRAEEMAEQLGGTPVRFEEIADYLPMADIVISSTGAPHYVLHKGTVKKAMEKRHNRPIFFIDIAVPRDIDPGVNDVYNAFLYDIDDLNEVAQENAATREKEAVRAGHIITEETDGFMRWLSSLDVVPTITALREKAERIKEGELAKTLARFETELSEKEKNHLEAMASAIVNKLLHAPTVELKRVANERGGYLYVESMRRLFNLNGASKHHHPHLHQHRDEGAPDEGAGAAPSSIEAQRAGRDRLGAEAKPGACERADSEVVSFSEQKDKAEQN